MKKILFVCTGNTCRSPMAEAIFNHEINNGKKGNEYKAWSAGLFAMQNSPISENALCVLRKKGIKFEEHKSSCVTEQKITESEIVVTMTQEHKEELLRRFPQKENKIFTFYEIAYDDKMKNVNDPFGGSCEIYEVCANEIYEGLIKIIEKI